MKKEIPLDKANRIINNGPVVMVSTVYKKKPNIFSVAWSMPVSHSPSCVAISSGLSNFSTRIIKETKEFVINVPDVSLKEKVIGCGSVPGDNVDKFKRFELTPVKSKKVKAPAIQECIGHLECRVHRSLAIFDHIVFVGRVMAAYVDRDKWDFNGNIWRLERCQILHHMGGEFFSTIGSI
ncbi:MAG: flavin reductase family protein [Spirochaetes bacterium]|nr:flavin reductase family protein [Spirochaetota bacterium]